jgi:chloride channel protein, CIC family
MSDAANPAKVARDALGQRTLGGLPTMAGLSLLVGGAAGLVCGLFKWLLARAEIWRTEFVVRSHDWQLAGLFVVVVMCAAAVALAVWLVRRFSPYASGSGIPHVEAVLNDEIPPAAPNLLMVKFTGGLLAIGAGLALGREGPSVQMGAILAKLIGGMFRRNWPDCRLLLAAGAGAGLAVAFNAPIAGAVFVLEELVRRFDIRTTIVTFGASAGAIAVNRLLFGDTPDFLVEPLAHAGFGCLPLGLALGVLAGLLGVAYNRTLLGALSLANRLTTWPVPVRAAAVGAAVGLLGWWAPALVGGGDLLTQRALTGLDGGGMVIAIFLLRFGLGPVSYAVGTPGGLFAPLLVLGAQSGLFFGNAAHHWFPGLGIEPVAYAVTGMAAFFTAVVRAPLTGFILVIELTGSYTQMLPMLAACFAAMLVATLLNSPPIYDSLKQKVD